MNGVFVPIYDSKYNFDKPRTSVYTDSKMSFESREKPYIYADQSVISYENRILKSQFKKVDG